MTINLTQRVMDAKKSIVMIMHVKITNFFGLDGFSPCTMTKDMIAEKNAANIP